MKSKSYVLITPARNEEKYIEGTIQSVINQTLLPKKWIVVSDGSTDGTDRIVRRYVGRYDFIELSQSTPGSSRNFGSKVNAFKIGYEKLKYTGYDFIGNLDADITFERGYYEEIIRKFIGNKKLGVAGGVIVDVRNGKLVNRMGSQSSVGCAIQLFRRQCYEDIGGYLPLSIGGEDAAAEIMARMKEWEVKSFPEIKVLHHRQTGSGMWNLWGARFYRGKEDYLLGYHPVYFMLKCIRRVKEKPFVIGSFLMTCGYGSSWIRQEERQVPVKVMKFLRKEQISRVYSILNR